MKAKKAFLITLMGIALVLSFGGPGYADLNAGLVARYPLDGNANDSSGNGNHGTEIGDVVYATGQVGQAITLDGVDDWIDVGDVDALDGQQQLTISAIINPSNLDPGSKSIVSKHDSWGGYDNWIFSAWPDGRLYFGVSEKISDSDEVLGKTSSPVVSANKWQHVAVVFDGSQPVLEDRVRFYYNGVEQDSTVISAWGVDATPVNSKPVLIGASRSSSGARSPFPGEIDEVYLYSRALSDTEIQELYNLSILTPYDTFDGSSIDTTLWNIGDDNNVLSQSGGLLQADGPPAASYGQLYSTRTFTGDFEFVLQYQDIQSTATDFTSNTPQISLQVSSKSSPGDFIYIFRGLHTDHHFVSSGVLGGTWQPGYGGPASPNSGMLKISRTDSTITTWYNEGAGWVTVKSFTNAFTGEVELQVGVYTGDNGTFHVASDGVYYKGTIFHARQFDYARLFSETRQYDPAHYSFDESSVYYDGNIYWCMQTFAGTSGAPPLFPVYLDSPVYADLSSDVPVQLDYSPDYYGTGSGLHFQYFHLFQGFAPPGNAWEDMWYTFFIDENGGNGVLDPGEPTIQWFIPTGSLRQLEIPQNVTFSGDVYHPTISWDPVTFLTDGRYLVNFYSLTDDGFADLTVRLDSSPLLINNSYTYTGDLFKDGKGYAVWVQAREDHPWASSPGSAMINRSGYFTKYQVVEIGDTGDNVEIGPGEAAYVDGVHVDGNLEVAGGNVHIDGGSLITGNVECDGGEIILENGSIVEGNLEVKNGGEISVESGCWVIGNVEAEEGSSIDIENGIVYGNVEAKDDSEVIIASSTIYGDVITEEGTNVIFWSTIYGNISSTNDGWVQIEYNSVNGNLEIDNPYYCYENDNTVNGNNSGCP